MEADWWPWWVTTVVALVAVVVAVLLLVRSRKRSVRMVMGALVLVGSAAAVAAPFVMDGTEERLTRQEFARKADANCEALDRFAATLGPANTLPQTERYLNRLLPALRKALDEQGALVPPKDDERTAAQWMTAMEAFGHDLEAIRDAAKQGDRGGVAAANQRSARDANESARLSKELGMRVCFS